MSDNRASVPPIDGPEVIARALGNAVRPPSEGNEIPSALDHQLSKLELNDKGNAERMLARFPNALINLRGIGWCSWEGRRWSVEDGDLAAKRIAHQTQQGLYTEAR